VKAKLRYTLYTNIFPLANYCLLQQDVV